MYVSLVDIDVSDEGMMLCNGCTGTLTLLCLVADNETTDANNTGIHNVMKSKIMFVRKYA